MFKIWLKILVLAAGIWCWATMIISSLPSLISDIQLLWEVNTSQRFDNARPSGWSERSYFNDLYLWPTFWLVIMMASLGIAIWLAAARILQIWRSRKS